MNKRSAKLAAYGALGAAVALAITTQVQAQATDQPWYPTAPDWERTISFDINGAPVAVPPPDLSVDPGFSAAMGGFDGVLETGDGTIVSQTLCEVSRDGVLLCAIDNGFTFNVEDFVGAAYRERDGVYEEGFAGEWDDGSGIALASVPTPRFKAPMPLGTWCAGMGGASVKCESEHYVAMHRVTGLVYELAGDSLPCLDPSDGVYDGDVCNPNETNLDNTLFIVEDAVITDTAIDYAQTLDAQLVANENTIRNDIATSTDYSLTKKDDGKALYRWGTQVKRPTDNRLYARIALPEEWKQPGAEFVITKASLEYAHTITNNPNDQVRPEDMENEGASGDKPDVLELVLPSYTWWFSDQDCYLSDNTFAPAGTWYKDTRNALPSAYSEGLREGLSSEWYTTIDRDPFASADAEDNTDPQPDTLIDPVTGEVWPNGPRWRLTANKFGQDDPGLEIPAIECSQPPFVQTNIRYPAGDPIVSSINLLDFEDLNGDGIRNDSPLLCSTGWVDTATNFQNIIALPDGTESNTAPNGVSVNGVPMSQDFDVSFYVKGDQKAVTLNTLTLKIEYTAGPCPVN